MYDPRGALPRIVEQTLGERMGRGFDLSFKFRVLACD